MKHLRVAIWFLLPVLLSCRTALSPADIAGEYVLRGTPVVLEPGTGRLQILADTLRVATDGSVTRVLSETYDSEAGSYADQRIEQYRYSIRGGRVELAFVCPPNALALCTPPPHFWGTPNSAGLALRSAIDPTPLLQYDRQMSNVRTD